MIFDSMAAHMRSTNTTRVNHSNVSNVENVATFFNKYDYGSDANPFALPTYADFNGGVSIEAFMGYNGVVTRGPISNYSDTTTGGNKKLDLSINKLKDVTDIEHYIGFVQDGTIFNKTDAATQVLDLIDDGTKNVSIQFLFGMLPMFNTENDENVFTFDAFGSTTPVWANDKDLLALYFYNSDTSGIWSQVKEFILHEEGLDHKIDIYDEYMYDVYSGLGIDYIEKA